MPQKKERKSILLPAALVNAFKVKCAQKNTTMAKVLIKMINKYLNQN